MISVAMASGRSVRAEEVDAVASVAVDEGVVHVEGASTVSTAMVEALVMITGVKDGLRKSLVAGIIETEIRYALCP